MSLEREDPTFVREVSSSCAASCVGTPGATVLQSMTVPASALGGSSCSS